MKAGVNYRPTRAVIRLDHLRHNVRYLREHFLSAGQKFCGVVKADAYGHGAVEVARVLVEEGVDCLAVATLEEGLELRAAAIELPILVFGLFQADHARIYQEHELIFSLCSTDVLAAIIAAGDLDSSLPPLKLHVAVDTGMGRLGLLDPADLSELDRLIQGCPTLEWEGIYTHFSTAEAETNAHLDQQWERWEAFLAATPARVKVRHACNSATALWQQDQNRPQSDWVRFGMAMYGCDPTNTLHPESRPLKAVMEVESALASVRNLPKGSAISYGATYETTADEWIGVVPMGYADGWHRNYQDQELLIDGHWCPVRGIINMDMMMVGLDREYPVGTPVTIIGREGDLEITAMDVSQKAGTIAYEVTCGISQRVPRVYVEGD